MKKLLLSTALSLGLCAPAFAQVNVVPQIGQISSILKNPTYNASVIGLIPAASATDIFCLNASATKNVILHRVTVSGTAGTAITTPFLLNRHVSLDTGGTSPSSGLNMPVPVPNNPNDPAATATAVSYTANPTIVDTTPVLLRGPAISLAVTTSVGRPYEMVFGTAVDMFEKGIWLAKNTTQQLCVNLNGVSVTSGVLAINMEWTETY